MGIPSKEQCFRLMCEMKMMDHIAAHSLRVYHIAAFLVEGLNAAGEGLNSELVRAAALLHDITKTRSFATTENHAETGEALLRDMGYLSVSRAVGQHVRLDALLDRGVVSEAEVVNYSDKRVLHDEVVSLDARFDYIVARYARAPEDRDRIGRLREETAGVEKKVFDRLPFAPEDLARSLDAEAYTRDLRIYRDQCDSHPSADTISTTAFPGVDSTS